MSNNKSKWVNTELKGDLVQEFEIIKKHYGIGNNADVVRFLVRQEARRIAAPFIFSASDNGGDVQVPDQAGQECVTSSH